MAMFIDKYAELEMRLYKLKWLLWVMISNQKTDSDPYVLQISMA